MIPRPMLCASSDNLNLTSLPFPLLASPKLDGIRALITEGRVFSRNGKLIPNLHVQKTFGGPGQLFLSGLDGELVVGNPRSSRAMQETVSGVMSAGGQPDISFFAFDIFLHPWSHRPFHLRLEEIHVRLQCIPASVPIYPLYHTLLHSLEELLAFETEVLEKGYEGIVLRCPSGPYKFGRTTKKEFLSLQGGMMKVKHFTTTEATVIGMVPAFANNNEVQLDAFGLLKRSSAVAGKSPKDTLGSFQCTSPGWASPFNVAPGILSQEERYTIWQRQEAFLGKTLTFKHFTKTGTKDLPRFPRFVSWRPDGG